MTPYRVNLNTLNAVVVTGDRLKDLNTKRSSVFMALATVPQYRKLTQINMLPGYSQKTVIVESTHEPGPKIPMRDDFATAATFVTLFRIYESTYKEDGLDYRIKLRLKEEEKDQLLTTNCWITQIWTDYHLRWNTSDFDGIGVIRIPYERVWRPDIILYNKLIDRLHTLKCLVLRGFI
uniref:SFRICE_023908 n=1 Tax=Spodoptera frugiperda TaxID=7108 RepID=A0A2H1VU81_SPOFR